MINLSFDDCKDSLNQVITNIIKNYDYVPTSGAFMMAARAAYFLGTRFAGFYKSQDIMDDSPFNALVLYIKDKAIEAENGTFKSLDLEQKFNHLSTISKRIDVITDICLFNENTIQFLSHEPRGIRKELSKLFFDKIIKDDIEALSNKAVKDFSTLFSTTSTNLDSLSSLIQITYLNGPNKPEYTQVVDEVILPKIEIAFSNQKCTISDLPQAVIKLRKLFETAKDLHFVSSIRKLFLKNILQPKLEEIKIQLKSDESIDKVISGENNPLISVMSIVHDDECDKSLMELFDLSAQKVINKFAGEGNVRVIAQSMLDLLSMSDKFIENTFESRLQEEVPHSLKQSLSSAQFHPKTGSVFAAALAFVFDALLKRGNVFKKKVTMSDVIRLLSYVSDRDVFLKHYEEHLFRRLATRASSSRAMELECLNGIAGVVHEDNLSNCREILSGGVELMVENLPDFRYVLWRSLSVPDRGSDYSLKLPSDYKNYIETCEKSLQKKWPERKFAWRHGLATAEGRLKTPKGVSNLTLSLAQAVILKTLAENGKITFEKLFELSQIDRFALANSVRALRSGKVLIAEKDVMSGMISINNGFHAARAIVADNWTAKEADTKDVPKSRAHALQAAAVRLMKKSRIMRTQQLVDAVIAEAAYMFPASPNDVRVCLKFLETNGYIEQRGDNHYIYVE